MSVGTAMELEPEEQKIEVKKEDVNSNGGGNLSENF